MTPIWTVSYIALWLLVLALAVMVLLLYRQLGEMYIGGSESRARDGLSVGARAPAFALPDQGGRLVSLPSGIPTILVFGTPTCGPCRSLMPHLVHFSDSESGRVNVVFVSGTDPEENRRFAADHEARFPVLTRPDPGLVGDYRIVATPFAFFLDAQGVVRGKGVVNRLSQIHALVIRSGYAAPAPMVVVT